jgi:hypothetical protein
VSKIAATVGAVLCCLSAACGTDTSDAKRTASGDASQSADPAASPSRGASDAGSTVTASPGCVDVAGDSTGGLDLTSVAVDLTEDRVLFVYTYRGAISEAGTLLLSTLSGTKQYGYKTVDGNESSHFVFDGAASKQENVEAEAVVGPTEATIAFPLEAVDVDELSAGTATLNVNGQDVDECRLLIPT